MRNWWKWLCLIVFPLTAFSAPEPIQLKFATGRPVHESSQWSITIETGGSLLQLYKKAQANLELVAERNQGTITKPPFDLKMNLKGIQVGADGTQSSHFDSEAPQESLVMQEIAKTVNEPVTLTIGNNLQISSKSEKVQEVMKQLQQAGGFQVGNLFSEMVQHLFALAGEELHQGDTFTRSVAVPSGGKPVSLEYQIVKITPQEIRAVVQGNVPSWSLNVKGGLLPSDGAAAADEAQLFLSGNVSGKIVWSRSNALIYKAKIDYDYQGTIATNGRESPITIQLHHLDSTNRL